MHPIQSTGNQTGIYVACSALPDQLCTWAMGFVRIGPWESQLAGLVQRGTACGTNLMPVPCTACNVHSHSSSVHHMQHALDLGITGGPAWDVLPAAHSLDLVLHMAQHSSAACSPKCSPHAIGSRQPCQPCMWCDISPANILCCTQCVG